MRPIFDTIVSYQNRSSLLLVKKFELVLVVYQIVIEGDLQRFSKLFCGLDTKAEYRNFLNTLFLGGSKVPQNVNFKQKLKIELCTITLLSQFYSIVLFYVQVKQKIYFIDTGNSFIFHEFIHQFSRFGSTNMPESSHDQ